MIIYRVPFVQFVLPEGRRTDTFFNTVREEVWEKANEILNEGFEFQCEVLSDGTGSFTVSDDDGDYTIRLVSNAGSNPDVISVVEDMILKFDLLEKREVI